MHTGARRRSIASTPDQEVNEVGEVILEAVAVFALLSISHQLRRIRVALGETVNWWQL